MDPGIVFSVHLKVKGLPSTPVGPNKVLPEQGLPAPVPPPKVEPSLKTNPTPTSSTSLLPTSHVTAFNPPSTGQRLLDLVQGAFLALNHTSPNVTESCWLCLAASPPYYEGIATSGSFNNTTSHESCHWESMRKLTLTEVSGKGFCLGNPPGQYKHLCNNTQSWTEGGTGYLRPEADKWWACGTGLTPCISTSVFNGCSDFCILVQLIPPVVLSYPRFL